MKDQLALENRKNLFGDQREDSLTSLEVYTSGGPILAPNPGGISPHHEAHSGARM